MDNSLDIPMYRPNVNPYGSKLSDIFIKTGSKNSQSLFRFSYCDIFIAIMIFAIIYLLMIIFRQNRLIRSQDEIIRKKLKRLRTK